MNTPDTADEAAVAAWLCTRLAALSETARVHRWSHRLDAALAAIRAGASVSRALSAQHIPIDSAAVTAQRTETDRGDPATLSDLGIDPVAVTGDYACPASTFRCDRRARHDPDTGHEPRCGITERTMTYQPHRPRP
ncbi:hypothetical protein ACIBF5_22595 [Micromonospora sp. NPDC050417]|uniref:hypothetical protein n=1 Tax=Micromonospora sp. NPDC050417 TaxID=3364280 RepID=UPI0037A36769